ncbi:hypothetical protein BS17DRAFT_780722 [Gyrodon lividus]|nr:hypothetical protein BS17DRAFT_780722 [Gyrodon lividus]
MTQSGGVDQALSLLAISHPLLLQITEHTTTAVLTVIIWESIITFGDEVTYIWSKPRSAHIKWLYLFGKYFGVIAQITNFVFLLEFAENIPIPVRWCQCYHAVQVVCLALLLLAFDTVLLLRVYALYGRNRLVIALALFAVVMEFVMTVASGCVAIPANPYDPACLLLNVPSGIIIFMVGSFISQTILLGLAYRKKKFIVRANHGRASVAWVTIRDGICAFAAIISLLLILLIYLVCDSGIASLTLCWFPVILSIATCRLIINMQQASCTGPPEEFTTEIWGLDVDPDSLLLSDMQICDSENLQRANLHALFIPVGH